MCNLCSHNVISSSNLTSDHQKVLGVIGAARRRNIHAGKKNGLSESALRAEWQSVNAIKDVSGRPLRRDLKSLFREQRTKLIHNLEKKVGLKVLQQKDEILPFIVQTLLDWAEWFERTKDEAKPGTVFAMREGYNTGLNRIAVEGPDFTSNTPRVQQVLQEILGQTKRTQDTFQKIVAQQIQIGLSEGQSMSGIVARVASKTEEQIGFRLDRIVQTASRGGFEAGQRESFRDSGIQELRWLTERDARVRTPANNDKWNHRAADSQTVGINDPFLITGKGGRSETLRFPGDPMGSPGNTIYCRCTIRPVS